MRVSTIAIASCIVSAAAVQAQDPPPPATPCKAEVCSIYVEWGAGGVPLTIDRKYGSPAEYLPGTLRALEAAGHRFTEASAGSSLTFRLRPSMVQAMCDFMPGTGTDMSCRMIGDVEIEVQNAPAELKLPGTIRIRNRCGDDRMMNMAQFTQFSAATIAYHLSREEKKKRPSARC